MSFHRPGKELEAAIERAKAAGVDPKIIETLLAPVGMFKRRDEFTLSATSDHSETLAKIRHETFNRNWKKDNDQGLIPWVYIPTMFCGRLQGQFLKSLVSIQRPKRILEVGLFTGYGALSMAEALPADGEIVSLDICESLKNLVQELTKDCPHAKKIRIEIGPALDTVKKMAAAGEKFDMMFLDGEKTDYIELVKLAFERNLLSKGGTVLVDNAYIHGAAYCPEDNNTLAHDLQEAIQNIKPPIHRVLIPMNDGVLMLRRMTDVEIDSA